MSKEQAIIHYLGALAVFENWLDLGIISKQEFKAIASMTADKYNLPKGSIYR